ncbi:MAG: Crp/Fnr family transcriptional regulator [Bacteroides sp.]|nr:Crp/Fnr family transcriptional regulator [Bacteroides sp.]
MNQLIPDILKAFAPFTDYEIETAEPFLRTVSIKKGSFFSKAGMITDRVGFVSQGLLRSFYTIKDKETTTYFLQVGSFAAALLSFLQMKPAVENIQALEDSELIVISRKDLFKLYDENWKWQQVGRVLIENYYVIMEQRSIGLQSLSAQERYAIFLKEFPDVIKSVPLHQIASFLGITPETLSRIRSQN